jgi:hypothetical protein
MIISTTKKNSAVFAQLKKDKYLFVLIYRKLPRLTTNYASVDIFRGASGITRSLGFQIKGVK